MKNRILFLSLTALVVSLTSCLKDEKFLAVDETAPIVEFPIGGPGVVENNLEIKDASKNFDTSIAINIASPQPLDRDVQVTVQVTPTIVTEYNTASGNTYTPLPQSAYSIDNYTITIPKGYRIGRFKIKLLVPKFDFTQSYALGLQIVNAPGLTISGNFNKFLWSFNVANQYAGNYKSSLGYFYHPTAPRAIPAGADKHGITVGANSIATELGDFNGVLQGATTYYVTLTVDPATNKVTIGPGPASLGPAPSASPVVTLATLPTYTPFAGSTPSIYNNTWDPVNKKFYLRYGYLGGANLDAWRVVEEVLTKQ